MKNKLTVLMVLALLAMTQSALADDQPAVGESIRFDSLEPNLSIRSMTGVDVSEAGTGNGLWRMVIRMFDDEHEAPLNEEIMLLNPNMPGQVINRRSGSDIAGSAKREIDSYGLVIWMVPEATRESFLAMGHLELPAPNENGDVEADPARQRELFEELLNRSQHVQVSGLNLYFYNPDAGHAEISLGWKGHDQPVRPPEFYRTDEERAAEEEAGLVYERGAIPVADITVYFSNGGEWAGGEG